MTAPRVFAPRSLDGALEVLGRREPDLRIVAGGTDLMVMIHAGVVRPSALLDLWKVPELRGITPEAGGLRVGALATYTDLARSSLVRERLPILIESAVTIGALQIQNRGTVGGNLANASPAADFVPVLFALEAQVTLASPRGERTVPVEKFLVGYRKTCLAQDELIASVFIPVRPKEHHFYRKVGTRRAQAISKVVMAAALRSDGDRIGALRVAVGSVAPTTVRLPAAENAAQGQRIPLDAEALGRVRSAAMAEVSPIDDVRSTADYRRTVLGNILARGLQTLASEVMSHGSQSQ